MRLLISLCFALLLPLPSVAQPLPCVSFDGRPVPFIANPMLNDVGVAHRMVNGQPVVQINPNVVGMLPEHVRQFWYAHECAHHALPPHMNNEITADCFAIKTIRNLGIVSHPQQVQMLLDHIFGLPGNISTGHLPGPSRAQNILACFMTP